MQNYCNCTLFSINKPTKRLWSRHAWKSKFLRKFSWNKSKIIVSTSQDYGLSFRTTQLGPLIGHGCVEDLSPRGTVALTRHCFSVKRFEYVSSSLALMFLSLLLSQRRFLVFLGFGSLLGCVSLSFSSDNIYWRASGDARIIYSCFFLVSIQEDCSLLTGYPSKSFWERAMLRSKSMTSKANLNYQLDAPLAFTRTLFNFVCPLWEIESSWHYAQIWWSICDDSCPGTDLVACQHVHVHDCLLKPLESSLLFCPPPPHYTVNTFPREVLYKSY